VPILGEKTSRRAVVADTVYNRGKYLLTTSAFTTIDLRALLIKTADNGALPSSAWDVDLNDVAALLNVTNIDELTGTGYVRKTLASLTATEDDTGNQVVLDAADVTWTGIDAGTARAIVIYKYNASDASAELISIHDTNFPKVTNGGDLTVQWPVTGVITGT
jgi:hypothetical protein